MTDDDGDVLSWTYDGKLLTANTWSGASGHLQGTVSYAYDTSFRLTTVKVNGSTIAALGYDNDDTTAQDS